MLFPFRTSRKPFYDNKGFIKLFEYFSFNLAHAFLAFGLFLKVGWSQSQCFLYFSFSFLKGTVEEVSATSALGQNQVAERKHECRPSIFWRRALLGGQKTIPNIVPLFLLWHVISVWFHHLVREIQMLLLRSLTSLMMCTALSAEILRV